jgi:Holliday junction resolvase RusA-like endonuclease
MKHTLSIPITPIPAPRTVRSDTWRPRPAIVRYHDFRDELRRRLPTYQLPGELTITFLMPMPKTWSKKKRMAMLGAPHQQRPDCDNLIKAWCDSWQVDDSHVYEIHAAKYWSERGSIEIEVED